MITASARLYTAAPVASGADLDSGVIDVRRMTGIGLVIKAVSAAGAADVSIQFAVSPDGTNFGAYDNVVETSTDTAWTGNSPEDYHTYPIAVLGGTHIKFRVTELATNADTIVDATLTFSEETHAIW